MSPAQEQQQDNPGSRVIRRKRAIVGRSQPGSTSVKPLGVIFVSAKTPFMSVVKRAIKVLDRGPGGARWSATRVLPLAERIAQVNVGEQHRNALAARQREVLLLATGHAITKLLQIAAWFQRDRHAAYVVTMRTRWSITVDDIFTFEGSGQTPEETTKKTSEGIVEETGAETSAETHAARDVPGDMVDTNMADLDVINDLDGQQNKTVDNEKHQGPPHKSTHLRNVNVLEVAVRLR